jgi:hypothetical protein
VNANYITKEEALSCLNKKQNAVQNCKQDFGIQDLPMLVQ